MSPSLRSVLCAVILLSLSACKQGEGARCEIDADCESGLSCAIGPGKSANGPFEGTCGQTGGTPTPVLDAAVPDAATPALDAGTPDAANDAAVTPDATRDAGGADVVDAAADAAADAGTDV